VKRADEEGDPEHRGVFTENFILSRIRESPQLRHPGSAFEPGSRFSRMINAGKTPDPGLKALPG